MAGISAAALVGVLALAGCGNDAGNSSSSSSSGSGGSGSGSSADCFSGNLTGEGSTAQKNAIDVAVAEYSKKCADAQIAYNGTGSGAGIKQFSAQQVQFGGSDSAMKPEEKTTAQQGCGSEAWDLPMVVGPIAVAFNVKGVDKLTLDAPTLAQIFSGKITTWNDPAIAKLNSGVNLPSTPIKVYFRSDDSGTTENFTKYLAAAAPQQWTSAPGKKWTGGVGEGKQGSAGVAQAIKGQDGGIGYIEWSYVTQNQLKMAAIDNAGTGKGVELNGDSVGKAVSAAKVSGTGNDLALTLDYATKADGAYPIVLVTYELVCSKYKDANTGKKVKAFMSEMANADVQKKFQDKGYAPLPSDLASKVTTAVNAIQ